MEANYENILQKIAKSSGMETEEIERRVEAKRAKLSGLISKEGAAQVIAAELGINFENEKLNIDELLPGMRKANVVGKVIDIFPIREFERNGQKNKVANLVLADETSNIKVVLWDTNHIDLIEKEEVHKGKVVEIANGSVRENEVHLGSFSELKLSDKSIGDVVTEKIVKEKNISGLKQGDSARIRAFIVQAFNPKFFDVNAETGRKASEEDKNSGNTKRRALMNVVLDDGSETIRAVMFNDVLESMKLNLENFNELEKEKILGKEFFFSGNARMNSFFKNVEFTINGVEEINVEKLLAELEAK